MAFGGDDPKLLGRLESELDRVDRRKMLARGEINDVKKYLKNPGNSYSALQKTRAHELWREKSMQEALNNKMAKISGMSTEGIKKYLSDGPLRENSNIDPYYDDLRLPMQEELVRREEGPYSDYVDNLFNTWDLETAYGPGQDDSFYESYKVYEPTEKYRYVTDEDTANLEDLQQAYGAKLTE